MPRTKLQVTVAIVILGIIAVYAIYSKVTEIASACAGGIIALGMKLLEHTPGPPAPPVT